MTKWWKKVSACLTSKRGDTTITTLIGGLFVLMMLSFATDVVVNGVRWYTVSQLNTFLARTAGQQGGVLSYTPYGYPGGDTNYLTSGEIASAVQSQMSLAGVRSGDYRIYINGSDITHGGSSPAIDFQETVSTKVAVTYRWTLTQNFVPGLELARTLTSERESLSEFKYRYDDWTEN